MRNLEMKLSSDKKILTLSIDLSVRYGRSKSSKTIIIASTDGNVSIPGAEEHKIGVNVYTG